MKKQLELNTMKFFRALGSILASCSVSFVSQTFLGLGIMNKFLLLSLCERFSHNARCGSPASPIEIFTGDFFISLNRTICSKLTSKSLESNL